MRAAWAAAVLFCAAAQARPARRPARDPRIAGLGKSCQKNRDCSSRAQRCLHESDAEGKAVPQGFCVLPCAAFDAGLPRVKPGTMDPSTVKKELKQKPPPRCPAQYQCRSKGSGVPIDMCVKE